MRTTRLVSPGTPGGRPVLYVNSPTYTGGAEISLLTLMRHLDQARYVPVLVTSGEGQLAEQARQYGIETAIQEFPPFRKRYPWRYPASIARLARTMRRYRVMLVHTNCDYSLRYVMHACRLGRVPYVSHVRDFVRTWFQPANVVALGRAAAVVANSQAVAQACIQAGLDEARLRVIYSPVDVSLYQQPSNTSQRELRQDLGLPADAFIIGIVGQIQAIKGHDELVEAAPLVLAEVPEAHFAVAGAAYGEEMESFLIHLQRSIVDHGLTHRFHFLGFRHDMPQVMRSLDVLAVPSWAESYGRVVVEGLAAGCPVVGTSTGGIPEIIRDGVDGLLVPPHDPVRLASAIIRLAQDKALRERLRRAGPEVASRFDSQVHLTLVQALYDSVLESVTRRAPRLAARQSLGGRIKARAAGPNRHDIGLSR